MMMATMAPDAVPSYDLSPPLSLSGWLRSCNRESSSFFIVSFLVRFFSLLPRRLIRTAYFHDWPTEKDEEISGVVVGGAKEEGTE